MGFSDSQHLRKTVAGMCMVVGPLLLLGAFVASPRLETGAAAQLRVAAEHVDRYYIVTLIAMVGVALMVPAVLGLMHMVRERRPGYGALGGGLTVLGLLATMASFGISFAIWRMAADGVQSTDVSLLKSIIDSTGVVVPITIVGFLGAAGFVVLMLGMYRGHVVDWWMALFAAAGVVLINIAFPVGMLALAIVGSALLLVGLGAIGLVVVRESDADWEHTPDHGGWRPAATH
jgi:nitrate reductase NapE component